jgi:putative PEP-CTERM system TPR-repeat lipoprotein
LIVTVFRNHSQTSPRSGHARRVLAAGLSALLLAGCTDSPEVMLESAKGYLEKQDLNAAGIQLKNALQENASLAEARFLLGKVNLEQGDLPGAVKEFERALQLGYPREQIVPLLARALVRLGQFDRVLEEFDTATVGDPKAQAVLLTAVGDARMGKADPTQAGRHYEAALASDPDNPDARSGLSRARLFSGNADGAESEIRAVIAAHPEKAEAHAALAEIMFARQRPDEAVKALREAVRLAPSTVAYHYSLVTQLLRLNRPEEAAAAHEALKQAAPKHPFTRYLQALFDFRNQKFTEARDGVLQALKSAPGFLPAQLLAGSVLVRLGDHVQGRAHLNRVLERVPGQPMARRLLVVSHLAAGETARALEHLQPLLDNGLKDPALLGLAGQVYLANGDFDKAEEYLQQAATSSPADAQARMRLGVVRMAAGDTEAAFADLETASSMDQDAAQADIALVIAHMRRNEFDKALAAQEQLERKQANNPLTYNLRGGLMLARRETKAAREAFEKGLSINPDYLAAAINLARLDLAEKRPQDALERLKALSARNPANVEAGLAYAEFQRATGAEPAAVLASLERTEKAAPAALPPKLAIVQHHLRNRDVPKALAVAQNAVAAYPNDPRALEVQARTQLVAGEHQQAIAAFNRLAGLLPQSPAPLLQLAEVHHANKDNSAAEQSLRRALALQPDSAEIQRRLAVLMLERGDRAGALGIASSMQRKQPQAAVGYLLEAEIHANGGKWAEAVTAYRKTLERARSAEVVSRLHAALFRLERKAEAERLATDWLREQPRDLVVRGYLSERALGEKRYTDAAALLATMHEIAPQNALVLNNLAWAANQNKDAKALEYAEQALALAPDNAAVLDTVGVIQIERGQVAQGIANLERAVSLAPEATPLRLNLARAYAGQGRGGDARKELETLMPKLTEGTPIHTEATALMKTL